MSIPTMQLHFEPRPWTSPCAVCSGDVPNTITFATSDHDAVCDGCAEGLIPQAPEALKALRAIDAAWWRFAEGDRRLGPAGDAAAYLQNVAAGVASLVAFYVGAPNGDPTEHAP
jgi:hypothetical protein